MSYIRTRYRALHKRFGTAGMIIAVIALVAALSGTALAAKGALTGKQKKEVEKIAKKFAGKPGAPGAAGTNGTNGTNGKDGAAGTPGAKGEDGEDGAPGAPGSPGAPGDDGETPAAVPFGGIDETPPNEGECDGQGGVIYETASDEVTVCNGQQGLPGPEGSAWTLGGTLPSGATETGAYSFNASEDDNPALVPISFPIPLPASLDNLHVHFATDANFADFDEGGTEEVGCKASFTNPAGNPAAEPTSTANPAGHLCVYLSSGSAGLENATYQGILPLIHEVGEATEYGTKRGGALLKFSVTGGGVGHSIGAFAVTAP